MLTYFGIHMQVENVCQHIPGVHAMVEKVC
jgi:hypothetical protein